MVRLVGPGGAGKSTIGSLLADRLHGTFSDLDRQFHRQFGDISECIDGLGYDVYARNNVEAYCTLLRKPPYSTVVALSSGFMTYVPHVHPEYCRIVREIKQCPATFS